MAEDDEEDEKTKEEVRKRNHEYLHFRREFDTMKTKHEGIQSDSQKLKTQGNQFFSLGCYSQAAIMYSEALELQPNNPVLYCNRAMAYLKQDMADEALADAEMSLELDSAESNIKAFWRKAQALLDLERPDEAEAAADAGIAIQAGNQHLNRVRRKAREAVTLRMLSGHEWVGQLQNGIEKKYKFCVDGSMTMHVFGHPVEATFELSVEGNPRSMVVRMKPPGASIGNGPPPPPMPYIYEFHDDGQELWLCHPVGTSDLPTRFEGPGFDRMRRAPTEEAEEETDSEPLDERCRRYMQELNQALPVIPPQLPARPSEEEVNQEALIIDRLSQLKRRFGLQVHQRSVDLAKDPGQATGELAELSLELRRRLVARKILPQTEPGSGNASTQAPTAPAPAAVEAALEPPAPLVTREPGCLSAVVSRLCRGSK